MEACHSQDKFNITVYGAIAMVIITPQAFAGMWINAFIVSVLCVTWLKKKTFNSNEKILLVLGCSRFWFLCTTWIYFFFSVIYPWCFFVRPIPQLFAAVQSFFNCYNLWASAFLCVFYCIKIATFRHIFFIYLKLKIDRIVPWLLLGLLFSSLFLCILAYDFTDKTCCQNLNSTTLGNMWQSTVRMDEHFFPMFFISGLGITTAFLAVIFSVLLLLFSLWRHKCKMQTNSMKDLSMDAHIKAMKSILSFFFIYSINFICLVLMLIYTSKMENSVVFLTLILQYVFPSVHSLILILSNPKLKKALLRTLPCVKCKVCMK
ncbi:taste receptor type 2 member 9-like [Strix uralensis]|uniref:taste receptor type 2 member 9-like n=1 Tax=Strix uralensis TaxID=36305 RepID=UPI003DA74CE3